MLEKTQTRWKLFSEVTALGIFSGEISPSKLDHIDASKLDFFASFV